MKQIKFEPRRIAKTSPLKESVKTATTIGVDIRYKLDPSSEAARKLDFKTFSESVENTELMIRNVELSEEDYKEVLNDLIKMESLDREEEISLFKISCRGGDEGY